MTAPPTSNSEQLYARARKVMVGGVSSPVRAFKAVGGTPRFIVRGQGSKVIDADGNSLIDYVLSWGPLIAGHAHPAVVEAAAEALRSGTSFGAPSLPELELAEEITGSMPGLEKVRFVNSGTEACMSALRLARAYTGRRYVVKFAGCYHGHSDLLLSRAGSGVATFDAPDSAGVPPEAASSTITLPYNDEGAFERLMGKMSAEIAAIIVEPVAGNMGVVPASAPFLRGLRKACSSAGALLVFDEVITGFRLGRTGAQGLYGVRPDLTCLGKVIGGGFPVGAYGGPATVMEMVSPEGPVYQAGTLSGNPVATAAGLATLSLMDDGAYARLERTSASLESVLLDASRGFEGGFTPQRIGSMLGLFFCSGPVTDFEGAGRTSRKAYAKFHASMLRGGVYLAPSPFETMFLSTAHSDADLEATAVAARASLKEAAP
jgi:glutamate-1-semialdehyde 2,1-aminomutase